MSEADAGTNNVITIKVLDQSNNSMIFKMKKDSSLQKVFNAYAERAGVDVKNIRFMYDGQHIQGSTITPKMLEMEDGDEVQAFLNQVGGFSFDKQ